jgi:hypothetical protein
MACKFWLLTSFLSGMILQWPQEGLSPQWQPRCVDGIWMNFWAWPSRLYTLYTVNHGRILPCHILWVVTGWNLTAIWFCLNKGIYRSTQEHDQTRIFVRFFPTKKWVSSHGLHVHPFGAPGLGSGVDPLLAADLPRSRCLSDG